MTFNQFEDKIRNVNTSFSIRDNVKYMLTHYDVERHVYNGVRESTGKPFLFDVKGLYQCFCEHERIATTTMKAYIKTRAQSPACAVLVAAKLA